MKIISFLGIQILYNQEQNAFDQNLFGPASVFFIFAEIFTYAKHSLPVSATVEINTGKSAGKLTPQTKNCEGAKISLFFSSNQGS